MTKQSLAAVDVVVDLNPVTYAINACDVASMATDHLQNDIRPVITAVIALAGSYDNKDLTRDELAAQLLTIMRLAITGQRTVDFVIDTLDGEHTSAADQLEALRGVSHG